MADSAKSFEVEFKFPIDDVDSFRLRIQEIGANPLGEIQQEDRYFNHPLRDFRQSDEALRIRNDGSKNCVTYKGPKLDPVSKTRREIEIDFTAGDDARAQFAALLTALSFKESACVRKRRERFELAFEGTIVEVTIDHVEGLKDYVELEAAGDANEVESLKAKLQSLASQLGLSGSERRSYLEMLEEARRT